MAGDACLRAHLGKGIVEISDREMFSSQRNKETRRLLTMFALVKKIELWPVAFQQMPTTRPAEQPVKPTTTQAPVGMVPPGPNFQWRMYGGRMGWVQDGIIDAPCPGGVCPLPR